MNFRQFFELFYSKDKAPQPKEPTPTSAAPGIDRKIKSLPPNSGGASIGKPIGNQLNSGNPIGIKN